MTFVNLKNEHFILQMRGTWNVAGSLHLVDIQNIWRNKSYLPITFTSVDGDLVPRTGWAYQYASNPLSVTLISDLKKTVISLDVESTTGLLELPQNLPRVVGEVGRPSITSTKSYWQLVLFSTCKYMNSKRILYCGDSCMTHWHITSSGYFLG